jgi:tetratricopeptide (TPR) repeat protein
VICSIAATALAAPGTAALQRAQKAWDDGEFDQAEHAYQEALDHGGLDRALTLDAWVHLGAARAVLGNKNGAINAFRTALVIDDNFSVPPEAGKKAAQLADTARRHNRTSMLHLAIAVPADPPGGEPFAVSVTLEPPQATVVTRLSLHVKDTTTAKQYDYEEPVQSAVHFRVPASMTLPGASLRVRVDALDAHDNQLAESEEHVTVRPTPIAETHPTKDELHKSGGFWSSPWPYLIGGALLAAGGATTAYFILRPSTVSIGPAAIETH